MRLESILNQVEKQRSFVYEKTSMIEEKGKQVIEVKVRPRVNGHAHCSGCGQMSRLYDTLPRRRFEYIPLRGIKVYFDYAMRRVQYNHCGVKVEKIPWATGKEPLTRSYQFFLARWAKRLSWQETVQIFGTHWRNVYHSVQ